MEKRRKSFLLTLTHHQWWWVSGFYAAAIGFLAILPVPVDYSSRWLDKFIHLGKHLLFAWLLVQAARASGWTRPKTLTIAFLVPVGYGLLLEGVQAWLPYRSAEWLDVVGNTVGAGCGLGIGWRWSVVER